MPYLEDGTPGGHRPQPARRPLPHERRADPGDAPGLGRRAASGEQLQQHGARSNSAPPSSARSCKDGSYEARSRARRLGQFIDEVPEKELAA